ncbi:hypothetical protein CQW23_06108 [Capsicum baccatum]|uniref:Ubiquitin-like protease family profile domain-containing protein n=1 Tax=Capsicum baccatum TaxID=33114 RepID=A0A2G2X2B7_CAPBA|nr:hypothetical protein CQW23_06108 [Capsicum baccatum]
MRVTLQCLYPWHDTDTLPTGVTGSDVQVRDRASIDSDLANSIFSNEFSSFKDILSLHYYCRLSISVDRSVQTLSDPKIMDRIKKKLFGAKTITRKIILEGWLVVDDDGSSNGVAVRANDTPLIVFETTNRYDYDHTGYTDFVTSSECLTCKCQDCKAKHDGVINTAINTLTTFVKKITSNKGFSILVGSPWNLVDEVYIPINCDDKFHWVLVIVVLKERSIRVYDLMSWRRRFGSSFEIQNLSKILPTYLDISGFLDQKVRTDWSTIEAYSNKMGNPFDVEYVEGIAQQPIGRLDYGFFVATYAEY